MRLPLDPTFDLEEPSAGESPVLVEVPHAGLALDAESLAYTVAPSRSIARDADLYVDDIFAEAPKLGATLLRARMSRYVLDLNRAETDVDDEAVEGGARQPFLRGLIWRLTTDGERVLGKRLPKVELERRLTLVYRPYHDAIVKVLERKKARFGFAILVCAHSMPSQPRRGYAHASMPRADLGPGTRGRTTAAAPLIDLVDAHARLLGWSVRHDDPYRGGFSTGHYGRPDDGVHAIQLEISRARYMDEASCRLDRKGFEDTRAFARTLIARMTTLKLEALASPTPGLHADTP